MYIYIYLYVYVYIYICAHIFGPCWYLAVRYSIVAWFLQDCSGVPGFSCDSLQVASPAPPAPVLLKAHAAKHGFNRRRRRSQLT